MQLTQLLSSLPQNSEVVLDLKKTPAWEVVKAISGGACTKTAIEITTGRAAVGHLIKAAGAVLVQSRVKPSLPGASRFEYRIRPEFEDQIKKLCEKRQSRVRAVPLPKLTEFVPTEPETPIDPDYAILRVPALLYRNRTFNSDQVNVALDIVKFAADRPLTVFTIHRKVFGAFVECTPGSRKRLKKLLRELWRDGILVKSSRGFQTHRQCLGIFDLAIEELKR